MRGYSIETVKLHGGSVQRCLDIAEPGIKIQHPIAPANAKDNDPELLRNLAEAQEFYGKCLRQCDRLEAA
jgi:hypothetical protein